MALTDTKVRAAKPQEKEYTLTDGDGMFMLVHPSGSSEPPRESWRLNSLRER